MLAYDRQIKRRLRGVVRELGPRFLCGRLVDIGCGYKPYERDLRGIVSEHVGVDYQETPYDLSRVDIVATAYSIPVADDTFDCALATEVLEQRAKLQDRVPRAALLLLDDVVVIRPYVRLYSLLWVTHHDVDVVGRHELSPVLDDVINHLSVAERLEHDLLSAGGGGLFAGSQDDGLQILRFRHS